MFSPISTWLICSLPRNDMAVIRIYDGKSFIGEVTEEQIIVTMGGEAAMANEHMKKDFEGLMAFVRSRSSEENGVITADMRELLKGNGLDARKDHVPFLAGGGHGSEEDTE